MNRIPPRTMDVLPGAIALALSLVLLAAPGLLRAALGAELVAAAFWLWSRLGDDRREQLARWGWLRRPATALWLAAALSLALPVPRFRSLEVPPDASTMGPQFAPSPVAEARDPLAPLRAAQALAVLWAGLELLAALPLSRPYPDLTGPLPNAGAWLPAALPAAGFLVLWRQADVWTSAPWLREVAEVALLLAAALAVLRAYTRRSWTASLRWLAVFDSAIAGLVVATDAVPREVAFLLWFAAAGGRLLALAAEIRGAAGRRGPRLASLWRAAGWTAGAALAWPLLERIGFADGRTYPIPFVLVGAPVYLAASLSLRRLVEVPERRALARPDPARVASVGAAIVTLALGPVALVLAWWIGWEVSFPSGLVALMPMALALVPRRPAPADADADAAAHAPAVVRASIAAGATARDFALRVFRSVTTAERGVAAILGGLLRALGSPLRDLHTGDAQEYLLFLVGVAVLALLLPLLR